ncbi:MAG TPA: cyclodeaminase/cyclohydrolase family protein, partial [Thermoplasmata archaeon]|nr:cyclodeaminase/cyclohydrolase family protein [Thermoplasmata archaeon]
KGAPDAPAARDALAGAVERAIDVPLETARRARAVAERLRAVAPRLKATLGSDLATAFALLEAARAGGVANARINLPDLEALGRPTATRAAAIASVAAPIGE